MSKYTTEVRFICESKSGLSESKGFGSVDEVLNSSWDKIFTSKVSFFDEEYRGALQEDFKTLLFEGDRV